MNSKSQIAKNQNIHLNLYPSEKVGAMASLTWTALLVLVLILWLVGGFVRSAELKWPAPPPGVEAAAPCPEVTITINGMRQWYPCPTIQSMRGK